MKCLKCGSERVNVATEQLSANTKQNKMGCLWTIFRWCLILCTGGLWLLIGKRSGTGNTKFKNQTIALCQSCGHKWKI